MKRDGNQRVRTTSVNRDQLKRSYVKWSDEKIIRGVDTSRDRNLKNEVV